jgi:hypothetical protein
MFAKLIFATLMSLCLVASANEAAPYSPDANERLSRIQGRMGKPETGTPDKQKNAANYLDYLHKLYQRADYDFPKSLEEYYRDLLERNGVLDTRPQVQLMVDNIDELHKLIAGMPAEAAFPGPGYDGVRAVYKRLREVEQGIRLSPEEIAAANQRRADIEAAKTAKAMSEQNARLMGGLGMMAVVTVIIACLVGILLWPLRMFLERKRLAREEKAAPYVYIRKHAKYPEAADKNAVSPRE